MALESAAPAPELRLEAEKKGPTQVLVHCYGRMVSGSAPTLQSTIPSADQRQQARRARFDRCDLPR